MTRCAVKGFWDPFGIAHLLLFACGIRREMGNSRCQNSMCEERLLLVTQWNCFSTPCLEGLCIT